MQLLSWLYQRMIGRPPMRHTPAHKPAPHFRPWLETLERRDVPSTLTVTSSADSGAGTLRADVAAASSGDTIVFDPSLNGQTITLTSGQLDISKDLTIQGPGAGQLTISGYARAYSRIFEVDGAAVNISGLTMSNGYALGGNGGAILNNWGVLNVSDCTLSNNRATYSGGAIDNLGNSLTVSGCTLTGNRANEGGAGVAAGTVTVSGSTLSGNSAGGSGPSSGEGGAISDRGIVTLLGTTVTKNTSAGLGGGIFNENGATLHVASKSVVTGNTIYDLFITPGLGTVTISSDSAVGTIGR